MFNYETLLDRSLPLVSVLRGRRHDDVKFEDNFLNSYSMIQESGFSLTPVLKNLTF